MPRLPRVGLAAILFAGLAVVFAAGQPPKDEKGPLPPAPKGFPREEEDPLSPGVVKKIDPDEDAADVAVPKGAAYFKLGPIARRVATTADPDLKQLFKTYSVAFDRVVEGDGKRTRVCPLPRHRDQTYPARFGAFVFTDANVPSPLARAFEMGRINGIRHFEDLAIDQARDLLKPTPASGATGLEKLPAGVRAEAAEAILTETLFFTSAAADQGKRKGPGWDGLRKKVSDELAATRAARLKTAVADKDWALARTLGARMIATYGETPERLEEVYSAKLAEAEAVLEAAGERPTELERVHLALAEYEAKSPKPDKSRVAAVRGKLTELSKKQLERADDLVTRDPAAAGRLVTDVSRYDPENPKVIELRSVLNVDYSMLTVGYRRLPERMTPALARYDSERHAVELIFEGLIEPVPDEQVGTWYRPVLAAVKQDVVPNGRSFLLQRAAVWAGADRSGFDAADVRGTVDLLRQKPGLWASYPLDWFGDVRADDPSRITITFSRGHRDPRGLVSFKILPARWLQANGKGVDDIAFGVKPFGTGPFTLHEVKPGEVLFRANAAYGRRPDRPGQPSIKEIRFVSTTKDKLDLVAELVNERIHVLPDVPTVELEKFKSLTTKTGKTIQVTTARDDRRVWTLAINHRNPALRDPNLRRGLTHAIDREAILDEVFRRVGSVEKPHAALTGPFPPNCWATPRENFAAGAATPAKAPPPLFNRDLAAAKFTDYLKNAGNKNLTLLYPADDAQAKAACEKIKRSVEDLAKIEGNALTLRLDPAVPADYFRRLTDEHSYDLAYAALDYPDDWYPFALGAALDPNAAGRGGRNSYGYLVTDATSVPTEADRLLGKLLNEVRLHRDPAKIAAITAEVHNKFNETVPFVPLWQLDRHLVMSAAVKLWTDDAVRPLPARALDPARLFSNVSKWRME